MTPSECLEFLQEHQYAFGFSGWSITVDDERLHDQENVAGGTSYAATEADYSEKTLVVTLYKDFYDEEVTIQSREEVLIHELIHARISVAMDRFEASTKSLLYELEEDLANDFMRGYELMRRKLSESFKKNGFPDDK